MIFISPVLRHHLSQPHHLIPGTSVSILERVVTSVGAIVGSYLFMKHVTFLRFSYYHLGQFLLQQS